MPLPNKGAAVEELTSRPTAYAGARPTRELAPLGHYRVQVGRQGFSALLALSNVV